MQVNLLSANLWEKCEKRDALVLPELCTVLIASFGSLNKSLLLLSGAFNGEQHNIILLYKMRLIKRIIIVSPLQRSREKGILRLP